MYSLGLAYFLWLISGFGALGFHRFYLGKILTGILWMCTGGLGMIGAIYDLITLHWQVREANLRSSFYNGNDRGAYSEKTGTETNAGERKWRYANDAEYRVLDGENSNGSESAAGAEESPGKN